MDLDHLQGRISTILSAIVSSDSKARPSSLSQRQRGCGIFRGRGFETTWAGTGIPGSAGLRVLHTHGYHGE